MSKNTPDSPTLRGLIDRADAGSRAVAAAQRRLAGLNAIHEAAQPPRCAQDARAAALRPRTAADRGREARAQWIMSLFWISAEAGRYPKNVITP